MGRLAVILVALLSSCFFAPAARAEFDWPIDIAVPDWDIAVGVTGGMAFGEGDHRGDRGWLTGADFSLLHDVFGLHVGLRAYREKLSERLGVHLEGTWWYLVMVGAGVGVGQMVGDGGEDVPDRAVALTFFLGVPIPAWHVGGGTLVFLPYGRPGLRILAGSDIAGFHEVGLMLKWTSFPFEAR